MNIGTLTDIARSPGDPEVLSTGPDVRGLSDRLARALGWFSVALGMTELLAARRMASALGMEGKETLVRAYGVREIAAGVMSLSMSPRPGIATRVLGDVLDTATLLGARRADNPRRKNIDLALAAVSAPPSSTSSATKGCGRVSADHVIFTATTATAVASLSVSRPRAVWHDGTSRFRATCGPPRPPARKLRDFPAIQSKRDVERAVASEGRYTRGFGVPATMRRRSGSEMATLEAVSKPFGPRGRHERRCWPPSAASVRNSVAEVSTAPPQGAPPTGF